MFILVHYFYLIPLSHHAPFHLQCMQQKVYSGSNQQQQQQCRMSPCHDEVLVVVVYLHSAFPVDRICKRVTIPACQSITALWALERSEKAQRRPGGRDAEEENDDGRDAEEENDDDGSGEIIMSSS